jgi:hypothetical protein
LIIAPLVGFDLGVNSLAETNYASAKARKL